MKKMFTEAGLERLRTLDIRMSEGIIGISYRNRYVSAPSVGIRVLIDAKSRMLSRLGPKILLASHAKTSDHNMSTE
jgi:hypothetical protein